MQLSGTSFAAPVVSGAAADILARHPDWTPDQVKGALMVTARTMSPAVGASSGVGELTADAAANVTAPPNPNLALDAFVNSSTFDSTAWIGTALANASWNSASWNSASWNSASWNSVSWNSVSWNSASWNSASWDSSSQEDAAEGETSTNIANPLSDPSDAASYPSWMTVPTKPSTG